MNACCFSFACGKRSADGVWTGSQISEILLVDRLTGVRVVLRVSPVGLGLAIDGSRAVEVETNGGKRGGSTGETIDERVDSFVHL